MRVVEQTSVHWRSRAHFFAVAAQAMRRVLVNHAKHHCRAKRGGGRSRVTLHDMFLLSEGRQLDIIALDEALTELTTINPQRARLVELRFFGGLTIEETAAVLDVSPASVKRAWRCARAWLYRQLTKGDTRADGSTDNGE